MKLTILGSCTVVAWPKDITAFFKNGHAIDPRNGSQMEMDALSIYHFANFSNDDKLKTLCVEGVHNNLAGNSFWRHGVWGHEEVHLRFTSSALRLLLLEQQNYSQSDGSQKSATLIASTKRARYQKTAKQQVIELLTKHCDFHERIGSGVWFYHDSIESGELPFYPQWHGDDFLNASASNKLILNTQLDTLTTLLIANKTLELPTPLSAMIDDGLDALEAYWQASINEKGWFNVLDSMMTAIYSVFLGRKGRITKKLQLVIKQFYYNKFRLKVKQCKPIRSFKSGFQERDIRLTGGALEYHVVNIWDMCKLLLWLKVNNVQRPTLETNLLAEIRSGLAYLHRSTFYKSFMKRVGQTNGFCNEALESIILALYLGIREQWLVSLYIEICSYSPPSAGVLGIDPIVTGRISDTFTDDIAGNKSIDSIHKSYLAGISEVSMFDGTKILINTNKEAFMYEFDDTSLVWSNRNQKDKRMAPSSVMILQGSKESS
ncbi:hypothetical protein [Thalassotalea euphylliae]|uniref:Uncharacterized protein n=1 Tax=Thalassotalea euphylliae TaxID=1655234 RepID=A0A3E0TZX1_9GAMM|nr:hypothetical protein [Thalassotalea euphylliae]REL30216.1 hypothetical protein DXX94_05570 [Thalassotalea euphylliae]